jgi:hypothetical protein
MKSPKRELFVLLAVLLVIGLFYVLTIREGHTWGDDFAMYILHAKNIVEGKPYADTGYIYNQFNSKLGPRMYPPVFPLLLAPVYRVFGLNLTAFKIEIILIFLAFLFLLFMLFRNDLTYFPLLTLILIVGLNPCFWEIKEDILSDIPFLLLVYLSLYFINQEDRNKKPLRWPIPRSLIIVLSIVLSIGTRVIGIALIPCLFIVEAIRRKKISKSVLILVLPAIVLGLILTATSFRFVSSYLEQFSFRPAATLRNVISYAKILGGLWNNEHSKIFQILLCFVFVGLAGIGYLGKAKSKITSLEVFPLAYFICLIIWPGYIGFRGIAPIIPLFIYYAVNGIGTISTLSRIISPKVALALFVVCISLSYAGYYSKVELGPFPEGVGRSESRELFSFIKENTHKEDIFIFRKPRALALFTERKASVYYTGSDKALWNFFSSIKASYLIVGRPFRADQVFLRPFLARNSDKVQSVYINADFEVFRIVKSP